MREILFRGYNKNVKRFIYGDLTHFENEIRIIEKAGYSFFVESETVGQLLYTDKKNNNYFNGDIFEHNYYPDCLCRVYFSEDLLAVVGQIYDKNGEYELVTILPSDFEDKMKLVGSVHENNMN